MSYDRPPTQLARLVSLALDEDVGRGDITTDSCVPDSVLGRCAFRARQPLVFCGGEVVREVFRQLDEAVRVLDVVPDGARLPAEGVAARVEGKARSILKGERVALNFVQRLSGTATLTRRYVDALPQGSRTRIVDTRKTTPGLRALERLAAGDAVTRVALELGYQSPSAFIAMFKRAFGVPPSRCRQSSADRACQAGVSFLWPASVMVDTVVVDSCGGYSTDHAGAQKFIGYRRPSRCRAA